MNILPCSSIFTHPSFLTSQPVSPSILKPESREDLCPGRSFVTNHPDGTTGDEPEFPIWMETYQSMVAPDCRNDVRP